ncbi:hypothetical protein C6496_10655 [Candidatus Poribacteria bacterium]|nr:MAG: hypothetical protein C6496_10655 [Candidatus Poribacteria bacterium]
MKKEIRAEVKRFFTSEAGRVGIRAPLALGSPAVSFFYRKQFTHHLSKLGMDVGLMMIVPQMVGVPGIVKNTLRVLVGNGNLDVFMINLCLRSRCSPQWERLMISNLQF